MKIISKAEFSNLFLQLEQIGINVKLGTENCNGEKDFYLEMLQMYCKRGKKNYESIKKLYENSNWTGYTARIHALKSTSLTIGAEKLSSQAEKMEQSGKNKNIAYIKENHEKLLQEYENIYNNIFCILNEQTSVKKAAAIHSETPNMLQQKKETEQANQTENYFLSNISHEIRASLNTMLSLNEMILNSNVREDITEHARNIQKAGKMLLTILNDLLDISKIKTGKLDILTAPYNTKAFFSDVIYPVWAKAKEKGLEFHLKLDPSIPGQLWGDQIRIKQILRNLLDNAIKYTEKGSVTLSAQCKQKKGNCVCMEYSVQDTGQGIKQSDIPYLFQPFQRMNESENCHIEGSGLGLSIAKQLADSMGGNISATSVYCKGSTFFFQLEQAIAEEKELGIFSLESCIRTKKFPNPRQFEAPNARLLIVDDSKINRAVIQKLLSPVKIQADQAANGIECLDMTKQKRYDLILMDHLMPEGDGLECLHAIRTQADSMCKETPVIALTAYADSNNQTFYQKNGFDRCLAKPVNAALLEAALLELLPVERIKLL